MPHAFPGLRGQTQLDDYIDFSGTVTAGATAQIVVPQQLRRLSIYFQNLSTDPMYLGLGPPRPIATISGGLVTGIANAATAGGGAGMGFTIVPQVEILGGVYPGDYQTTPQQFGGQNAAAHATGLTAGGITSFSIDNPGSGYVVAPLIVLVNPVPSLGGGACIPAVGAGILCGASGGYFSASGALIVPSGALAVYGATTNDAFVCKVSLT